MNSPNPSSFHADWPAQELRTESYVRWIERFYHERGNPPPVPEQSAPKPKTKRQQILEDL